MGTPRSLFSTVPDVAGIEATGTPNEYRLTLREASGHEESFLMTVVAGDIPVVTWDRDFSLGWPGDAASLRAVYDAVLAAHQR